MFLYLTFSSILFVIGGCGMFLSRSHMMMILMSLELLLLSMNMNFVVSSMFSDDFLGQVYVLLILTVAAAETALGLAILVIYYSLRGGMSMYLMNLLKS